MEGTRQITRKWNRLSSPYSYRTGSPCRHHRIICTWTGTSWQWPRCGCCIFGTKKSPWTCYIRRELESAIGRDVDLITEHSIQPLSHRFIPAWCPGDPLVKKENRVYLLHILDAIRWIEEYTRGMDHDTFFANHLVQDGVLKQIEVIGEAAKHISRDLTKAWPCRSMEWYRRYAGFCCPQLFQCRCWSGVQNSNRWYPLIARMDWSNPARF